MRQIRSRDCCRTNSLSFVGYRLRHLRCLLGTKLTLVHQSRVHPAPGLSEFNQNLRTWYILSPTRESLDLSHERPHYSPRTGSVPRPKFSLITYRIHQERIEATTPATKKSGIEHAFASEQRSEKRGFPWGNHFVVCCPKKTGRPGSKR